jgi:hypothetical protein
MSSQHNAGVGTARIPGGGKILEFKRSIPAGRRRDKPTIHPLQYFDDQEERQRMQQNLAAAVVIVLLIASGFWLIDHLHESARIAACVEAGHHNCVPIALDHIQGR